MQKLILSTFLILLLVPFSQAFSQEYNNTPTLSVSLRSETPFIYQDSEGFTVVVGTVENNDSLASITNVIIKVNFFDDFDPIPLEVVNGHTTLQVIPPNGQSPFAIRSDTANPNITQASVSLLPFDISDEKQKELTVFSSGIFLDSSLHFSGVLQNGITTISDTNVYLAFYDVFERILRVYTIEIGDVESNEVTFEFDEPIDYRSIGFLLFSESDKFYSDFVDIKIPPSLLVIISDVTVKDVMGNKLSEIKFGSTVNIESETQIQFAADQKSNETAYTYYVQIKETPTTPDLPPTVEYIGKFDGRFFGTEIESQSIDWVPEKKGLFFIETFVWDRNNIPIAEQGPIVIIFVN
ncbi:MAG TPA: hypothetical protein OQH54_07230 [Nitrosopumilus sp.]|nr:hypothetical protein [Thermoproteota archaeon]HJJ23486.1 hypothetical protein [Nitrosopumilus sp.]